MSLFFFFKQKTAYEVTRRDWSSDVCSSDLPPVRSNVTCAMRSAGTRRGRASGAMVGDRKSVVSGKSVPCCVDLGGRRILKTKKHKGCRDGGGVWSMICDSTLVGSF